MNIRSHTDYQEKPYIPRGLLLQWHITDRCNLRCSHCYQKAYSGEELQFEDLLKVLNQYKDLLQLWRDGESHLPIRGHITITGGEPFVRRDFLDLLEVFYSNREYFSFAILSNGSFIDASIASKLHRLGTSFVQVSIEGTKTTHDMVRGHGDFDKTVSAVKHLVKAHIKTLISFTAHQANFREFTEVARLGRRLRVSRVWADRLIPQGTGSQLRRQILTPDETCEFLQIMNQARIEARRSWFTRTEIAMHRSLQFLVAGGKPYHCTAGDSLITVLPNGDLYPCRRMPIKLGNLIETPLIELYYESNLLRTLRNRNLVSEGCQDCFYSRLCRGGLKCLSYSMTGDPFKADPGCWYASTKHEFSDLTMVSDYKS